MRSLLASSRETRRTYQHQAMKAPPAAISAKTEFVAIARATGPIARPAILGSMPMMSMGLLSGPEPLKRVVMASPDGLNPRDDLRRKQAADQTYDQARNAVSRMRAVARCQFPAEPQNGDHAKGPNYEHDFIGRALS